MSYKDLSFNPLRVYTVSLSPSAVAPNTIAEQNVTVTGVATDDTIINATKQAHQAGLSLAGARIASADTLALAFSNNTGASITPSSSGTYTFVVAKG